MSDLEIGYVVSLAFALVAIVLAVRARVLVGLRPDERNRTLSNAIVLGATGGVILVLPKVAGWDSTGILIGSTLASLICTIGSVVLVKRLPR